ncbi:MAG: MFS transporter [Actinobacteria bacterium]|nr:MFS transporter [Actinomycetota bacterium]
MDTRTPSRVLTSEFAVLLGATLAVFASFGMLVLALPLYVRDVLGASDLGVGVAIGVASIGAIVGGPVAGRVADRRGRRIVVIAAAAAMGVSYLILSLGPPLEASVPLRALVGVAEAAFVVAAYTMATDLAPTTRQGEAMSLITASAYGGLAIGPLAADYILGDGRFAAVWIVAAALTLAGGLAASRLRESRPHTGEEPSRSWLPPRAALLPGLVLLLALLGFGGFNAFVALYARDLGFERPGVVFLVFAGVVFALRVLGRTLPDRLGAGTAASTACVLVATGLVVVAASPTQLGLLVGTAIFAGGQALAYPAIALLATARATLAERSAAVGAVIAFVDVALASGAFVLGIAADAWSYRAVFAAGAVSAALGLVLLWWMSTRESGFSGRERAVEVGESA